MRSILTSPIWPNVTVIPLYGIVGIEVLQILRLGVSELRCRFDEGVFCTVTDVGALGNIDGTIEAVSVLITFAMIGLELGCN
jgi:hypothetical protein